MLYTPRTDTIYSKRASCDYRPGQTVPYIDHQYEEMIFHCDPNSKLDHQPHPSLNDELIYPYLLEHGWHIDKCTAEFD